MATTLEEDDLLYVQEAGRFTTLAVAPFTGSRAMGQSAAAADYDRNGFVDFFVPNGGGWYPQSNFLIRNYGQLRFALDAASPVATEQLRSSGGAFADFNNDGWMDLLVLNLYAPNSLFVNSGDGDGNCSFHPSPASPFGAGAPAQGANSAAWGDYDNDGDLDLFITHGLPSHFLYRNEGGTRFTLATNTLPQLAGGNGMGCAWADLDNNGWLDLVIADRTAPPQIHLGSASGTLERFTADSDPLASYFRGANGVALADYDRDGDLDVLLSSGEQDLPPALFRNTTSGHHFLRVQLVGSLSNHQGLGAKVRVLATYDGAERWQLRQIGGEDALGSQEPIAHFGLASATLAQRVRVEWPSGLVQEWNDVPADQTLTLTEPSPTQPIQFQAIEDPALAGIDREIFGAAWGDVDGDRRPDLALAALDPGAGLLLRNTPTGFSAVTDGPVISDLGQRAAAAWGDLDRDGDLDLFVVKAYGETDLLYRNDGTNGLTPVPGAVTTTPTLGISALWWDYDEDGALDLFVTTGGGSGAEPNQLYRNTPDGLAPATQHPITEEVRYSHGAAFADFTGDERPDLFVANAYGLPSLFRGLGNGMFESLADTPLLPAGLPEGCTLPVFADFDNDGDFDLVLPTGASPNLYFLNPGQGALIPASLPPVTDHAAPTAGAVAEDFNNDGWIDLLTVSRDGMHRLYEGAGNGILRERIPNPISADARAANGVAAADYDLDGDVDVLLTSWPGRGGPVLYRNDSGSNRWLRVKLVGTRSNLDGVGAVIRATSQNAGPERPSLRQMRQVGGWDAAGSHEFVAHFGLGVATSADLEIRWPSGRRQVIYGVAADQVLVVQETDLSQAQPETLGPPTLNRQTGLFTQTVTLSPLPYLRTNTLEIVITNLPAGVHWLEATSQTPSGPSVRLLQPPAPGQAQSLTFTFHSPGRQAIPSLTYLVREAIRSFPPDPSGPALAIQRTATLSDGAVLVEFASVPGAPYAVQLSTNLIDWTTAQGTLTAGGTRTIWIDSGPPATPSHPAIGPARFYRVVRMTQP
ncbi:MAG: VCBS repeat-containing protein [Verrucomicrobiales bacterium]|nr:VCBS repeat-containing protein [Verrucomicrobiales bacterium]